MPKRGRCIGFVNHKGGTGKTTSCLSIAGYLAKGDYKVLVVDFDPQANATSGLGIDMMSLHYSMYDAILGHCGRYAGVPITRVILETQINNLHLAPSELDLSVAELLMFKTEDRASVLNRILEEVKPLYDYILIDLPPSSGLLAMNGLCASDQVVVPLDPSIFSLEALGNLKMIFRDVKSATSRQFIDPITVLLTRYRRPNVFSRMFHKPNPSQLVEIRLREMFRTVFVVPDSPEEIFQAQREGIPISHSAPESRAGKVYAKITKSIIMNGHQKSNVENERSE